MLRSSLLISLLALGLAAGCKAQPSPQEGFDSITLRHIELSVRSQYNVPPDVSVAVGARRPSSFNGYDELPITLSKGAHSQVLPFLISKDGKTLGRMETYDLVKDPMSAIDLKGRPVRGNPNAKVTIVSYDDLECPYCARMHETLFPGVLQRYKDQVRIIYKDDPLVEIHPWAMHASVDGNCLAAQSGNAYWAYIDYVHAHLDEVTGETRDVTKSNATLDRIARQEAMLNKADGDKLDACLAKQDQTQVKASAEEAGALGVEGTPALFIDGERLPGLVSESQLWMVIDRALRARGVEPPPSDTPAPRPAAGQ